jgi:hypothetical protein
MRICNVCKIEKIFTEFPTDRHSKHGVRHACKECYNPKIRERRLKNKEKYADSAFKYANGETGYLKNKVAQIFSKQNEERTGIPIGTREDFYKHFYEYVKKHGKNCYYCFEPWTYTVKRVEIGAGRFIKKTKRINLKNLSFDRLDTNKPYNVDNIIFCCQHCNVSKNNVSIKLIKRLYEVITERNL